MDIIKLNLILLSLLYVQITFADCNPETIYRNNMTYIGLSKETGEIKLLPVSKIQRPDVQKCQGRPADRMVIRDRCQKAEDEQEKYCDTELLRTAKVDGEPVSEKNPVDQIAQFSAARRNCAVTTVYCYAACERPEIFTDDFLKENFLACQPRYDSFLLKTTAEIMAIDLLNAEALRMYKGSDYQVATPERPF